jgi:hypothetical protein
VLKDEITDVVPPLVLLGDDAWTKLVLREIVLLVGLLGGGLLRDALLFPQDIPPLAMLDLRGIILLVGLVGGVVLLVVVPEDGLELREYIDVLLDGLILGEEVVLDITDGSPLLLLDLREYIVLLGGGLLGEVVFETTERSPLLLLASREDIDVLLVVGLVGEKVIVSETTDALPSLVLGGAFTMLARREIGLLDIGGGTLVMLDRREILLVGLLLLLLGDDAMPLALAISLGSNF